MSWLLLPSTYLQKNEMVLRSRSLFFDKIIKLPSMMGPIVQVTQVLDAFMLRPDCGEWHHAGVPIKRPVAGIAMGLVMSDETGKFTVLSDILGTEDALGDMDFKVCPSTLCSLHCNMMLANLKP